MLPNAFYPDYKKHGIKSKDRFSYKFSYQVSLSADRSITSLSIPSNAQVIEQDQASTRFLIRTTQPGRTIDLFYRTSDMLYPELKFAKNPETDEIAVSVTFVPTFDPSSSQCEILYDWRPKEIDLGSGADFHFIFILDRSESMGIADRMELAKDALRIFLISLPIGCMFSIISFGSGFMPLKYPKDEGSIAYSDESKDFALAELDTFESNFRGTEILEPLEYAQKELKSGLKKRIFLLTDGAVFKPRRVIA